MDNIYLDGAKSYCGIDYDDDDATLIIPFINIAVADLEERSSDFDKENPTDRQKILIYARVKDMYDHREKEEEPKPNSHGYNSLWLSEILGNKP